MQTSGDNVTDIQETDSRIPVYIVTGFLGSGKTTLLNHWVNSEEFKDTLVLINEFGDVGLDHDLVQAVDDTVVLLGSGCICCSLQGELINALAANLARAASGKIPAFSRVLIETTGLADPAGVITTLANDEFIMDRFRHAGTVTILDAQFVREQLKNQYEAVKQVALADLILISKTDLVDADEIDAIYDIASKLNGSAKIYPVLNGNINPRIIEEIGPYKASQQQSKKMILNWLSPGTDGIASPFRPAQDEDAPGLAKPRIIAHTNIESFALTYDEPIEALALLAAITLVQEQYGDSILRLKGILNLAGQDKPVVIHGVQGNLYPLTDLAEWPYDHPMSKIVFIVRASVLEQIRHIFTEALEHPDEATMRYYQNLVNAADDGSGPDAV